MGEKVKYREAHTNCHQYQMVSPETIDTSNNIQNEQVIFVYLGINMHTHICM